MRRLGLLLACTLAMGVPWGPRARGAEAAAGKGPLPDASGLESCTLAFGSSRPIGEGIQEFADYVDLDCREFRIQADRLVWDRGAKTVAASGNVSLAWQGNRLAGASLLYHLDTRTGSIEQAIGTFPPDAIVRADRMEKTAEDMVLFENGVFTSCTQPTPYWSLRIRRGRLHLGHYATLHGVALRAGAVPLFYTPWLVWPIKGDRATGLLFPQFGSSRTFGNFIGDQFFWPARDNLDLTLQADYYERASLAGGIQFNWLPNARGRIEAAGYGLRDERPFPAATAGTFRYKATFRGVQRFGKGWKASADLNDVSDRAWYADFERALAGASTRATVSALHFTRNWSYYTLAFRGLSRDQYFPGGSLRQRTLPEIEWRSRSRQIGRWPVYFSFLSSANLLERRDVRRADLDGDGLAETLSRDVRYGRLDLGGRLSAAFAPAPWLDAEGALQLRETYYTKSRDPLPCDDPLGCPYLDAALSREFAQASIELIGPRFFRVYERSGDARYRRLKHVIEPRLFWQYVPTPSESLSLIPFDEVDFVASDVHQFSFGVRQRLFAKKAPAPLAGAAPQPERGATAPPWGPASMTSLARPAAEPPTEPPPASSWPPPPAAAPGAPPAEAPEGTAVPEEEFWRAPEPAGEAARPPLAAAGAEEEQALAGAAPQPPAWPDIPAGAGPAAPSAPAIGALASGLSTAENPVEIASLEISQDYSFNAFRSPGSPVLPETAESGERRHYSPLTMAARLNPSVNLSVDLRASYDWLQQTFLEESLSASARAARLGYANLSWVRRRASASFLNLSGGTALLQQRLRLDALVVWDQKASRLLDRGARVAYYTQCCGFIVAFSRRESTGDPWSEVRFVLDLKGIGKFLDLGRGTDR